MSFLSVSLSNSTFLISIVFKCNKGKKLLALSQTHRCVLRGQPGTQTRNETHQRSSYSCLDRDAATSTHIEQVVIALPRESMPGTGRQEYYTGRERESEKEMNRLISSLAPVTPQSESKYRCQCTMRQLALKDANRCQNSFASRFH